MRKTLLLLPLLAALSAAALAEETRPSGAFDAVEVAGGIRVEIRPGPVNAVVVSGPEAAYVRTRVRHGELQIAVLNRPGFGHMPAIDAAVHVTTPRLQAVKSARGAQVFALNTRSDRLDLDATMGAQITVGGVCGQLEAAGSMGAQVDAGGFACDHVHVTANMGANMRVNARQRLEASTMMGGVVEVRGNPQHRSGRTLMGGEIHYD